jgi:aldose 1-epimerase
VGGKTYQLEANNGPNHLHGCFNRKLYRVKSFGDTLR